MITIGILKETKTPPDKRSPFTPTQALEITQRFPQIQVMCQSSAIRCFPDDEYRANHITVQEDMTMCDVLMGIKEVKIDTLLPNKTYLFFSHTMKKQPYNRKLLQTVLEKNITLIDYEALKDIFGNRLVAFGRYAGIVGAYNALWAYGLGHHLYTLRRAHECFDINDLKREVRKIKLPPIKIVLTGGGRVGRGAMEVLDTAGIKKVEPHDFLEKKYTEAVYTQLSSQDYHTRKEGGVFNRDEFHHHPERYEGNFLPFARVADILVAGAFWNPKAPVLFTQEDTQKKDFALQVIADITCDINGSIPTTKRASSIVEPLYDYDKKTGTAVSPFSSPENITVMAVDNLPCELPRSASEEFGRDLINHIIPLLDNNDHDGIIDRATLARDGKLTSHFAYLQDYVNEP